MKRLLRKFKRQKPIGQSLVETAIFLPILILLMAGVAEVANLLVTQNRVSTASRVATGFGASHYQKDFDWSQTDPVTNEPVWAQEMAETALNNVTETLDLDTQRWDIWTITGTLDVTTPTNQTSFGTWHAEHAYGNNQVVSTAEWNSLEPDVQNDVLDALNDIITDTISNDGLGIIATVAYHDRSSLLGLNAFNFGPLTRVRGLNVMRIDDVENNIALSGACIPIPVAIRFDQYSLYPTNWYEPEWDGESEPTDPYRLHPDDYPGDPVNIYPPEDDWQYPDARPNKPGDPVPYTAVPTDTWPFNSVNSQVYEANVPGIPLEFADLGFLYQARLEDGPGGFGWLDWDGPPFSGNDLDDSLTYPGNYYELYPGSPMDTNSAGRTYDTGDSDGLLENGEYVHGSTGNINSNAINAALQNYVEPGTKVLMVVYDYTRNPQSNDPDDPGQGSNMDFHVVGFVYARIIGYEFGGNDKWMVFEFLGWADNCPILPSS